MATNEERLSSLEAKFEAFMHEVHDMRQEMRDRDNQRAAEIIEMRQKHDADIRELNARIDSKFDILSSQIQNLTVAAVVGFGAIAVAVGGLIVSALK